LKATWNAPTTFRAGIVDKSLKTAKASDHSQQGTKGAKHDAPEPPVNKIEEKNKGKEKSHHQALIEMGLPEGENRPLQEIIEGLRPDDDEINIRKIEKSKNAVNQSIEDRLHGQGHGADEEGNRVQDSHPL